MTIANTPAELLASSISTLASRYAEKVQAGENADTEIASIVSACKDLDALVTPPESWNDRMAMSYTISTAIALLLNWDVFQILAAQAKPTSLETLATSCGCSKSLLRCALREAVAHRMLDELSPETYALNSRSSCLLDENKAAWIHYLTDIGLVTAAYLPKYVKSINGKIPEHSHRIALQMAFNVDETFYEFLHRKDPKRGVNFDKAMQRHIKGDAQASIESVFDFSILRPGAVVVDVGGGKGHHCIRIAKKHPHLSFIIQDYEANGPSDGEDTLPEALARRVRWQRHNFHHKQPMDGADVYLLSNILMDNTVSDCNRILTNIVDAMVPNHSVLLVDDAIDTLSEDSHSAYSSSMNLHMLSCFGTLFRTQEDWLMLFSEVAGGKLSIVSSWMIDAGRMIFALRRKF
ncbi:hypothetical protein FE257_001453 [Aspergillus nanangensis]|uniref:N-methyltransferase nanE n=2 Tax=Aspergillus nanangensis TaxID=2582783 RepID=NANE_ASPNN|nr:RecName: Full=N-methyltransferase nanE; AltName: Full=Nanangelenin A biosynthesis cluster protein E [Aspergillus nanangensis]KAF9884568.1 hypothetical protein FE257_001453 [Aspergillus nanangensis]QIQ51366.1 hypothetical protein FE257_001453 [Aspergillus nanangensis]